MMEELYWESLSEWRIWLQDNHHTSKGIQFEMPTEFEEALNQHPKSMGVLQNINQNGSKQSSTGLQPRNVRRRVKNASMKRRGFLKKVKKLGLR